MSHHPPTTPDKPAEQILLPKAKPTIEALREMIGFVSAGAGLFAVLFYLAGRSFAGGYFGQMNIPSYQISFSLLEYGEVAWLPLFLFPILFTFIIASFAWVIFIVKDLLSPLIVHLLSKIRPPKESKRFRLNFPKIIISKQTDLSFLVFFWAVIGFLGLFFIAFMMTMTDSAGRNAGRKIVLETAQRVELVSAIPLALDDNNLVPVKASGQDYYTYTGLHLLTFNSGKYYLFKEIDPSTCKPLKVYIINAEREIQINLAAAEDMTGQCGLAASP